MSKRLVGGEYTRGIVEKILLYYCENIVERLRDVDYKYDGVELDSFASDFCVEETYLRKELDETFEICHHHQKWSDGTSPSDQADLYTNYAAFLHDVLKHYDDAEKWNLKALQLNGADSTIYWNLAELYKDTEQNDEAIRYYDLTLKVASGEERQSFEVDVADRKRFIESQQTLQNTVHLLMPNDQNNDSRNVLEEKQNEEINGNQPQNDEQIQNVTNQSGVRIVTGYDSEPNTSTESLPSIPTGPKVSEPESSMNGNGSNEMAQNEQNIMTTEILESQRRSGQQTMLQYYHPLNDHLTMEQSVPDTRFHAPVPLPIVEMSTNESPFTAISEVSAISNNMDSNNRRGIKRKLDDREDHVDHSSKMKEDNHNHQMDVIDQKPSIDQKLGIGLKEEDALFVDQSDESESDYDCKSVYAGLDKRERAQVRMKMHSFRAEYAKRCEMTRNWNSDQS